MQTWFADEESCSITQGGRKQNMMENRFAYAIRGHKEQGWAFESNPRWPTIKALMQT